MRTTLKLRLYANGRVDCVTRHKKYFVSVFSSKNLNSNDLFNPDNFLLLIDLLQVLLVE